MSVQPAFFESHAIGRVYDENTETWLFSVIDIIQVLTQQRDYQGARKYWKVLKGRLAKEGSQLISSCYQLKLAAAVPPAPTFSGRSVLAGGMSGKRVENRLFLHTQLAT